MSTRTERRREQTHQALLDALYNSIIDDGIDATTVAAIAERADVAVGTFYNHFDSREDAITDLARQRTADLGSIMRNVHEDLESMGQVIELIARGSLAMIDEDPRWARFMAEVSGSSMWPRGRLSEVVTGIIEEGQRRGEFNSNGPASHRAYLIGAQFRAIFQLHVQSDEPIDAEMVVSTMLATAGDPAHLRGAPETPRASSELS